MIVCSSTTNMVPATYKCFRHCLRVALNLLCISGKLICKQFAKSDCLSRNDVFERPSLCSGKYSHIEYVTHHADISFGILYTKGILKIFSHQNDPASGSTQSFMSR